MSSNTMEKSPSIDLIADSSKRCKKGFTVPDLIKHKCERWAGDPLGCTHCPEYIWDNQNLGSET